MLSTENQFYKNLLLMNMGVLFISFLPGFTQGEMLPISFMLIFCFFLLSQFYFGNFKLRLFSLAIPLVKCLFIGSAMWTMKNANNVAYGMEPEVFDSFFSIVFLVPLIYMLFNTKIWYNEITEKSGINMDERQRYIEYVPLVLTVILFGFNMISGNPENYPIGIQSLYPAPFSFDVWIDALKNNLLSKEALVVVPAIAILYFGRRNIQLGISILGVYVVEIVIHGIVLILKRSFAPSSADFQFPVYHTSEVVVKFILPIVVLVLYWRYFDKHGYLRATFRLMREPKTIVDEERPVISIEDLQMNNSKLIQNEAFLMAISQVLFGIYLMIFAYSKSDLLPFILLFGAVSVLGSTLLYIGAKSWNGGLATLGFVLQALVPFLVFSISAYDRHIIGRLQEGVVMLSFFSLIVLLVWGIPIMRALMNPNHLIHFVQNRDNSRIHNAKPGFQMDKFDGNQKSIDLYSDELVPWKQRKLGVLLFLGFQAVGFIGLSYVMINLSYTFYENGSGFKFLTISEVIVLLMLYVAILKWGMFQNMVYCILMLISYGLTTIMQVFQLLNASEVSLLQGIVFLMVVAITIYFGYMISQLAQRRRKNENPIVKQNPDILD